MSGIHKMSNAIFRPPADPTVVRRPSPKARPPLKGTFDDAGTSGDSNPTTPSNSGSSKGTASRGTAQKHHRDVDNKPTAKSAFTAKDPNTLGRDPKPFPTNDPRALLGPCPDSGRTTLISPSRYIDLDSTKKRSPSCNQPSIATVERTAAAKIYLETHFNELLAPGPSPRQMRQQVLETELFNRARERGMPMSSAESQVARAIFRRRESEYLREMRNVKVKSLRLHNMTGAHRGQASEYETVRVLGRGSFGVVKLVREHRRGQVYAMKVIKKNRMLKTSQEGHLRAERDILVASEGSRWIVPLVASFQDLSNLYLVMEYMPGGDFLSLLIRESILPETIARFYIAEIILCVEAAHSLKCIHRDIKPDNFLVSASGHLKISDFGLAFDGQWYHDATYYSSQR
ncbi:kinase-like domain-containing protein [Chaetomium sp. MPI-SDFR-AT-0129]|nr:kinase-like domain-containing protein [Chaetomium sp. MPI-SDFR-AT-0129]